MTRHRARGIVFLLAFRLLSAAEASTDDHDRRLEAAVRGWDVAAVQAVLSSLRATDGPIEQRVQAGLALAELLRFDFERTPEGERETRRVIGARIDAAAEEALTLLDRLPETSEHARLRADLLATMIRSDYRAQRYRDELESAVSRALELDPANPRALVSSAKLLIFAPEGRGRDLDAALSRLDRALDLEPGLEEAVLLKAHALELVGRSATADQLYREALRANPDCRPAKLWLEGRAGSNPG